MSPHILPSRRHCVGGLVRRALNNSSGKWLTFPVIFQSHVPAHSPQSSSLCWGIGATRPEQQFWKVADFPYHVKKVCVTFEMIAARSRREGEPSCAVNLLD